MKTLLLLAAASLCLLAADPPPSKDAPKEAPKISDAQRAKAWKASARYNSAAAKKNGLVADRNRLNSEIAAAEADETKARESLEAELKSLCPGDFDVSDDGSGSGEPKCAPKVKPIKPASVKPGPDAK